MVAFLFVLPFAARGGLVYKVVDIETYAVNHRADEFSAWPANNGLWTWNGGTEILVGFANGQFDLNAPSHRISEKQRAGLARSKDGGATWEVYYPENYVDQDAQPKPLTEPINFKAPGFVLKMCGHAYHAHYNLKVAPCFYYSTDYGKTWRGPWLVNGIEKMDELKAYRTNTTRTDYHVLSERECMVFGSVQGGELGGFDDKVFAFRTTDGGLNFEFVSWVVPPSDPYRAVMPQTVNMVYDGRVSNDYISAVRRRWISNSQETKRNCWVDIYKSGDGGLTWRCLATAGETGSAETNGNPPGLVQLKDGRLLVVYGNRDFKRLLAKVSLDDGVTWGPEIIIRDGYQSHENNADFGYPLVTQRDDGKIVVLYYFADSVHGKEQHIDCSIFSLEKLAVVKR